MDRDREVDHLPKALSAEEVAQWLGKTTARVYEAARQDLIPHTRMGRQIVFFRSALEDWARRGGAALKGGWRHERADEE